MDMVEMDYFSIKRRRGSIDEDEERKLEEYFNTSYVPLSNRTLSILQLHLAGSTTESALNSTYTTFVFDFFDYDETQIVYF
jgi:hypothetical protein